MNKVLACLIAVAAISMTANESQAQFYRGGSGFSIGIGTGFNSGIGYSNFNRGYGRSVGGLSINIGNGGFNPYGGFAPVNRGFYGGGVPYYVARPVVVPVAPVYRGGGFYGGGAYYRGGGYYGGRRNCGGW